MSAPRFEADAAPFRYFLGRSGASRLGESGGLQADHYNWVARQCWLLGDDHNVAHLCGILKIARNAYALRCMGGTFKGLSSVDQRAEEGFL